MTSSLHLQKWIIISCNSFCFSHHYHHNFKVLGDTVGEVCYSNEFDWAVCSTETFVISFVGKLFVVSMSLLLSFSHFFRSNIKNFPNYP